MHDYEWAIAVILMSVISAVILVTALLVIDLTEEVQGIKTIQHEISVCHVYRKLPNVYIQEECPRERKD